MLKIHEDSASVTTVAEISNLMNKAAKAVEDCTKAEEDLKAKKAEMDKLKDEFKKKGEEMDAFKAEMDKLKAAIKAGEDKEAKEEEENKKLMVDKNARFAKFSDQTLILNLMIEHGLTGSNDTSLLAALSRAERWHRFCALVSRENLQLMAHGTGLQGLGLK